jgi:hypothetical protein
MLLCSGREDAILKLYPRTPRCDWKFAPTHARFTSIRANISPDFGPGPQTAGDALIARAPPSWRSLGSPISVDDLSPPVDSRSASLLKCGEDPSPTSPSPSRIRTKCRPSTKARLVTSVCLGECDVVPQLGLQPLLSLRHQMVRSLPRSHHPHSLYNFSVWIGDSNNGRFSL